MSCRRNTTNSPVTGKSNMDLYAEDEHAKDIETRVRELAATRRRMAISDVTEPDYPEESGHVRISVQPDASVTAAIARLVCDLQQDYPDHEVYVNSSTINNVITVYLTEAEE